GDGFIAVVVTDCAGNPLPGATVSSNPAGSVYYNAGGAPSSTATSTATDGIAYIFDFVAGNVPNLGTPARPASLQPVSVPPSRAVCLARRAGASVRPGAVALACPRAPRRPRS